MRYHQRIISVAKIKKKSDNAYTGEDMEKLHHSYSWWVKNNVNNVTILEKMVWQLLVLFFN